MSGRANKDEKQGSGQTKRRRLNEGTKEGTNAWLVFSASFAYVPAGRAAQGYNVRASTACPPMRRIRVEEGALPRHRRHTSPPLPPPPPPPAARSLASVGVPPRRSRPRRRAELFTQGRCCRWRLTWPELGRILVTLLPVRARRCGALGGEAASNTT